MKGNQVDIQNAARESSMTMRRIARTDRLLQELGHPMDVIGALEDLKRCRAALTISLEAMQSNIAYATRKDEPALCRGIEAARNALNP